MSAVQDFKTLFADQVMNVPKPGDVIKGKVISVDRGEIHIDIEGMTTGVVRGQKCSLNRAVFILKMVMKSSHRRRTRKRKRRNGVIPHCWLPKAWDSMKKWMKTA